jgi:flavin-dependent dehydrogenase
VGSTPARIGRGGITVLRDIVRRTSPALAYTLHTAGPPSGLRTFGGLPGYMRVPWGPGWALVGDAGYWKDPLSAHGLTDSLRDAELLARAIIGAAAGDATEADAFGEYHETRNRLSTRLFDVVDAIAGMGWSDTGVAELLVELSAAMAAEVDAILAIEPALVGCRP